MFSVIYYWRDARQHGIYLLYIITKQTTTAFFISKPFNITRGPAGHFGEHEKAIWRNLLSIKMKQSRWLLCVCETTVIGPGKSRHCQTWLAWLLLQWKLTAKAELSCEIHRSSRKCWKSQVQSVFVIRAALWAEKLRCYLGYCRSWKNTLGKLAVAVYTEGYSNRVLNERSAIDDSCDTIGREL